MNKNGYCDIEDDRTYKKPCNFGVNLWKIFLRKSLRRPITGKGNCKYHPKKVGMLKWNLSGRFCKNINFLSATYSRQQIWLILVTKNCALLTYLVMIIPVHLPLKFALVFCIIIIVPSPTQNRRRMYLNKFAYDQAFLFTMSILLSTKLRKIREISAQTIIL